MTEEQTKMIDALRENKGLVTGALKISGTKREDHEEWQRDKEYARECKVVDLEVDDWYESQYMEAVANGNAQALVHVAKTRLSDRGYSTDIGKGLNVGTILIGYDK
jgi:hypothetical protein